MSQRADGEDIGEGAAPEITMDAALASGPPPNRNRPLTILPSIVEPQEDDVLAKGKGAQDDVFSSSKLEKCIARVAQLKSIDPLCTRLNYLAAQDGGNRGWQHQRKDIEYVQKIEKFIKKLEESSLDKVLSEEKDRVFLRQLLEDILDSQESSQDAETEGGISPDPTLAALAAAPSCHRRGNADELFPPVPRVAQLNDM